MPAHRHSFFQIFVLISGSAVHEIGDRIFYATPGSIHFISPYVIHRLAIPEDAESYVIYFDLRFLRQGFLVSDLAAQDAELHKLPELAPFLYQPYCSYELDDAALREACGRCERISAACAAKGIYDAAEARAELVLLLTSVAKRYAKEFRQADRAGIAERCMNRRARAALCYLKENFNRPLSLGDVAEEVHLTATYLTHLLKHETGKSFKQLLDELRLEHSKSLLAYTEMAPNEIALACGFLDQSHFAKRFKAYVTLTPGQFRKRHRTGMVEFAEPRSKARAVKSQETTKHSMIHT